MRKISLFAALGLMALLQACAVATTAVSVAGTVVSTTVDVAGDAVSATSDVVTGGDEDDDSDN